LLFSFPTNAGVYITLIQFPSCFSISSRNRVIAGLSDGRIGIVSHLKEGGSGVRQTLFDSMHHRGNVTALQTIASRDGSDKYILSGGEDGRILIWNAADGRCLKTLKGVYLRFSSEKYCSPSCKHCSL
jgi:WD40 repeat protein